MLGVMLVNIFSQIVVGQMERKGTFVLSDGLQVSEVLGCAGKCLELGDLCAGYNVSISGQCSMLVCRINEAIAAIMKEDSCNVDDCENNYDNSCDTNAAKHDCKAWYEAGLLADGIYPINPSGHTPFCAYCDMTTDGGGWTTLQRRLSNCTNFYRARADYISGFGALNTNFWLGLDHMAALTPQACELRVDLTLPDGSTKYAKYSSFRVGSSLAYVVSVSGYNGTSGDSLTAGSSSDGCAFSTYDHDVDNRGDINCAEVRQGAWWYNACGKANLNGPYLEPGTATKAAITWFNATGEFVGLKTTRMMVRCY